MANNPISMIKIRQILRLYTQGYSKLKIAEQTGIYQQCQLIALLFLTTPQMLPNYSKFH